MANYFAIRGTYESGRLGSLADHRQVIPGCGTGRPDSTGCNHTMAYAIRTARYRYIASVGYTQPPGKEPSADVSYRPIWSQVSSRQLYDMQEDPHETVNLAPNATYAAVMKELAAQLEEMLGE